MFKPLTSKLKHQVHPFVLLAAGLSLIGLVTALSGILHYQYELDHLSSPSIAAAAGSRPNGLAQPAPGKLGQAATQALSQSATQSGSSSGAKANSGMRQSTSSGTATAYTRAPANQQDTATTAPSTAVATVSLSVNGSLRGNVSLSSTANQCDVLTQALNSGLISNLDMRYNSQYGSYAVYVISGIGDHDSVQWTYTVNGKLPPLGCSKMPVRAGDSINWQYVKQ